MKVINQDDYCQEIAQGFVVVDFFATWCEPCKVLTLLLEELEQEFSNFTFCKLDSDQAPYLMKKINVMSVPTTHIYHDGCLIKEIFGLPTKSSLIKLLELAEQKLTD